MHVTNIMSTTVLFIMSLTDFHAASSLFPSNCRTSSPVSRIARRCSCFWKKAYRSPKRFIQRLVFPEGIVFDKVEGFRKTEKSLLFRLKDADLTRIGEWWWGKDSNLRTRKRADLQSAAIDRSATPPQGPAHRGLERMILLMLVSRLGNFCLCGRAALLRFALSSMKSMV